MKLFVATLLVISGILFNHHEVEAGAWPCGWQQEALNVSLPAFAAIKVEKEHLGVWVLVTRPRDQQIWRDWNWTAGMLRTCLPVNGSFLNGVYRIQLYCAPIQPPFVSQSNKVIIDLRTGEKTIALTPCEVV